MTLTQVVIWTRRGILSLILATILVTCGIIGYRIWYQYYLAHLPPVQEKPEMKFGLLPQLKFPPSTVASSNFAYSLDTATGGLPPTPKLLKVYFIPKIGISLMSAEKARQLAQAFGFSIGPESLSPNRHKFTDEIGGQFIVDLTTANFYLEKTPHSASSSATLALPDHTQLIREFKDYLSSKNLLTPELQNGRSNVIFSNSSAADSATAEISIWPSDIDGLPTVTGDFKYALVKAVAARGFEATDKFIKITYVFWPVDKTSFSTYPLKTPEQAFADLKIGEGLVTVEPPKAQVSISSIYLAYYQTEVYSPYLQPVFVFEGPLFAAIVAAIDTSAITTIPAKEN